MQTLPPPLKRHLTGRRPTHSSTGTLEQNFKNLDRNALLYVFNNAEYLTLEFKPTKKALLDGLIDRCEDKALWNLEKVEEILAELGMSVERQSVNQEIKESGNGEPKWVNLGTVGTYFSVTANLVGKWLDELELRDDDGMGNQKSSDLGLSMTSEMNAGGNKTRKITMWNLYPTQEILVSAGHELDFDYEKTLKGKGKSSDVNVTTIDDRAKEFAKTFVETFKNIETRKDCINLVKSEPKPVIQKAEILMKKEGFITSGKYLKYIR